jgi:hypothetical protein
MAISSQVKRDDFSDRAASPAGGCATGAPIAVAAAVSVGRARVSTSADKFIMPF